MSPIGTIQSAYNSSPLTRVDGPLARMPIAPTTTERPNGEGFGKMLDGLVSNVEAKDAQANEMTRRVLLGDSDQLHQSVIAMQEAGVAFSLMVEVRNKLVDSYQELMRMQV